MGKSNRLLWADIIKGICMMAILLFHTEVYYAGQEIIPYHCYVTNALLAFFFISGFFFSHPDKVFSAEEIFLYPARTHSALFHFHYFTGRSQDHRSWRWNDTA